MVRIIRGSSVAPAFGSIARGGAIATAILCLYGCAMMPGGPDESAGLDFALPPGSRVDGALIFVVDGVSAEIFERMLSDGELPAIEKHFARRGLYAPRAVANVPSVTLANLTSLATGRLPGHHGITGINWFDRNRLIWRNYETIAQKNTLDGDYTAETIFERFPGRTTFSVFFQPHRGATKFVENWTSAGPIFFFGWYEWVDRLTLYRLHIVADVARKRARWPAVTVCYLLAPDFRAYDHGVDSDQYRAALRHTDFQIGRVLGDLKRAGLLEKLIVALVSDHGHAPVTKHFPLDKFLRDVIGLEIACGRLWEDTPFEKRLDYYRKFPGVTYGSGDRYWAICLRRPIRGDSGKVVGFEPWPVRPTAGDLAAWPARGRSAKGRFDLLTMLANQKAVDLLAWSAGREKVRVRRGYGEVEFRQPGGRGGRISYHPITGDDPLGLEGKAPRDLLGGKPASGRQWLAATHATDYPDLPAQILAYFRAPRAGDIAVFAAPGWDFRGANRSGHGGLAPGDMFVPLLLAGPGIPHKRITFARTVDLVPTVLSLLGGPVTAELDGRSLLETAGD